MECHQLVKVTMQYVNALTGQTENLDTTLSVQRTVVPFPEPIPIQIDQHINRYVLSYQRIDKSISFRSTLFVFY